MTVSSQLYFALLGAGISIKEGAMKYPTSFDIVVMLTFGVEASDLLILFSNEGKQSVYSC